MLSCLYSPILAITARRRRMRKNAYVADSPPPIDTPNRWDFGSYCWKVTVTSKDRESGKLDKTFIGYSQNMNIANRTKGACDRFKKSGTVCGEPELAMKGGECDEVIFMRKTPDGPLIPITVSPF